jgi:hypothetical protein
MVSRLKACFDEAAMVLESEGYSLNVRNFCEAVGSTSAGKSILNGGLEHKHMHYEYGIDYVCDLLGHVFGSDVLADDWRRGAHRAFYEDCQEYKVLLKVKRALEATTSPARPTSLRRSL